MSSLLNLCADIIRLYLISQNSTLSTTVQETPGTSVEVDRATENPGRVIATCWRYQEHQAQASNDGVFPLVVWLVPGDRRRHRLERAIAHSTGLLRDLFRVIRLDQLPTLIHGGPAAIPTPQPSNQVGQ